MARDGSGNYVIPIPDAVPDTTISSAYFNTNLHDVANDLNTARPIVAGGTGANNAAQALINLGAVPSTGGSMTGPLTIISSTSPLLELRKTGAGDCGVFGSKNASPRWLEILGNSTAETGGNVGSDFSLWRFNDAGAAIDQPITVFRNTGVVQLLNGLTNLGDISMTKGSATSINATVGPLVVSSASDTLVRAGTGRVIRIADTTNASVTLAEGGGAIVTGAGAVTLGGPIASDVTLSKTNVTINATTTGALTLNSAGDMLVRAGTGKVIRIADASNAAITLGEGGGAITTGAGTVTVPGPLKVTNSTGSFTPTTGAVVVTGGVGVTHNINCGASILITGSGNGYKPAGGPWLDSSDARIKTVVSDYEHGLAEVLALTPRRYRYKGNDTIEPTTASHYPYEQSPHYGVAKDGVEYIGLIAQEVETTMPEMVRLSAGYIDGKTKVDDLRTLDTGALIYALVNCIKTLDARLKALEGG